MPVTDEDAAIHAIATLETLSEEQTSALASINNLLTNDEPFVDIHELFGYYDVLYFRKLLVPRVEVIWSPRLTLCAGICELSKDPETGKFTRIRLKLSTPLLQYRPRSDTINTLLHEAIHAYFFITTSWRHSRGDDGTGHGIGFQLLADAISNHGNYEITIYHTFHDEVESYRTHVWRCDGPCKSQPPYFGLVKRSMNRSPGKSDTWWARHEVECGGTYTKIQEPELTKKQRDAMSKKERAGLQKNKIDAWVKNDRKENGKLGGETSDKPILLEDEVEALTKSTNKKRKAARIVIDDFFTAAGTSNGQKRPREDTNDDEMLVIEKKVLVECPICSLRVAETEINEHLDVVHPP
ncbi:SprT-like family-domain-containing protein [Lophiotrema nucula]|uniref:Protein with SprT-like domain at the N terminus n=1 Tax=Lophiotrema nucula TaxID=690887 RepID=A0A6A5ZP27_9PLEO|nr:SprT-like family-domain-containing protein [Lophiotrema nucula]